MGQNYGKIQTSSPNLKKTQLSTEKKKRTFARVFRNRQKQHSLAVRQQQQQISVDDTITANKQTGNIIISIHMLTMNNSNEVNSNCRSVTGNNCSSDNSISSSSEIKNNESIDDQSNNEAQNNIIKNNQNNCKLDANSSTSILKKYNSKYNQATLLAKNPIPSSSTSLQQVEATTNNGVTCDNLKNNDSTHQNNNNNNNNVSNSPSSSSSVVTSTVTPSPSNNFRLSSCPFADKISNMLSSKCKFGGATSSSGVVQQQPSVGASSSSSSKVKKGILGKFKSSKQKNKGDDSKSSKNAEDTSSSLNTSNASSSSYGSDKTDTCTCTASSHRTDDTSNLNRSFSADHAAMSLSYGTNNSLLPSISITSGGSATTGTNATAIILPDSALIHSTGFPTTAALYGSLSNGTSGGNFILVSSLFDMTRLSSDDSLEDCDEQAKIRRAIQIEEGVEAPPGYVPNATPNATTSSIQNSHLQTLLCSFDPSAFRTRIMQQTNLFAEDQPRVHSQADYIHCLVPDLKKITSCCFYWGKMDRYEAEKLLDGKPEGTFLLRDSAQEEFLFSVSFRKYGRSLHARIEQFNHQFSFDSHDPGVYTATTVTGLLEHYKDPSCVMFFEPMLTLPLNRNFVFSLQELARATIVSNTTYDGIDQICVPKILKSYLKEYHYKQRVHYKRLDDYQDS
uniref:CSON012903 protein n=1 Tax=Culicoides sonorensis TaxID=179676 RepID=A0A336KMI3_CULSO